MTLRDTRNRRSCVFRFRFPFICNNCACMEQATVRMLLGFAFFVVWEQNHCMVFRRLFDKALQSQLRCTGRRHEAEPLRSQPPSAHVRATVPPPAPPRQPCFAVKDTSRDISPEQTYPPYPSAGNRCEMRVLFQTLNPTVSPICAIKSACKSLNGVAPPDARIPQKLHRSCRSIVGGRCARSTTASLSSIRLLPRKCSATSSKWTTTALPDLFLLIATRRRDTRSNLVLKARCALKPRLLVPPLAELTATTR